MSDKELKELVASLAIAQKELTTFHKELAASQKELATSQKELTTSQKELATSQKELAASQKEQNKEIAALQKETSRQINQVNKQLGELGNKWGTFTEGMAVESIKRILLEKFSIPTMFQRAGKRMNGESIEIDFLGYENSNVNTAVIVEVKSHLREDAIEQIEQIMANFPKFFPDHANKKLYAIIACVYAPDNLKNILRKKGIYLAVIHDDIFELYPFKNFIPKDFNRL